MKRAEFYHRLAYKMDIPIERAKKFSKAYEEVILEIIALEEEIQLAFGIIGGKTKEPLPAAGVVKKIVGGNWTDAKFGYPFIKWSEKALDCSKQRGEEYLAERGLTELFMQKYKHSFENSKTAE